ATRDNDGLARPPSEATPTPVTPPGTPALCVPAASSVRPVALPRPIRRLTQISDGISRGNLAATIGEVRRSDEIGSLARAIERLRASVKLAVDRLGTAR